MHDHHRFSSNNAAGADTAVLDLTTPTSTQPVIRRHPDGGWLVFITVDGGVSVSKWFDDRVDAERYAGELTAWVANRLT
jgi:hypothetical protein